MSQRNVAVLIFDEVEVLDFAGPFEVFSVTGRRDGSDPFNVYTVAETPGPVLARNRLSINPHYTFDMCPPPAIVVVPGGFGTRREMHNPALLAWVQHWQATTELLLSVCTGALILARAGLLDGLTATTHHGALAELRALAPTTTVDATQRVVDNGRIVLSAGIAAGIDMSLSVVAKLLGTAQAQETATYMEYPWQPTAAVGQSKEDV